MNTGCRYEFQLRHFGFSDCSPSQFYTFQWSKCKRSYLAYRVIVFMFQLVWLIYGWVEGQDTYNFMLSNWCMMYSTIYYGFASATVAYGIAREKKYTKRMQSAKSKFAFDNKAVEVEDSADSRKKKNGDAIRNDDKPPEEDSEKLQWFHIITWIFQTFALDTVVVVTSIYWTMIFPGEDVATRNIHGYAKHAINIIVLLIDMFLINTPIRWFHAVYMCAISLFYSTFLGIVYAINPLIKVYGFVDFENAIGRTLGILLSISLIGSWLIHSIWFGIYHLRIFIYRKWFHPYEKLRRSHKGKGG